MKINNGVLLQGDNLSLLKDLESFSVDLVYLDPPFNSNRNFGKFDDRWMKVDLQESAVLDMHPRLRMFIDLSEKVYGKSMKLYLVFIAIRLLELKRILKETGSIYLHCDDTAAHYIKVMMDDIFGVSNYRNDVIWRRTRAKSNVNKFARIHDNILFYTKSENYTWNNQYREVRSIDKINFREDDHGRWCTWHLGRPAGVKVNYESEFVNLTWRGVNMYERNGLAWGPPTKGVMHRYIVEHDLVPGWPDAFPTLKDKLDALDDNGLIYWASTGMPYLKYYEGAMVGRALVDVEVDIEGLRTGLKDDRLYPTQKPLALLEMIVETSSNPGDVVLDPFCGSGTTCVAAEKLGRRWIGLDVAEESMRVTQERLSALK